MWSQDLIMSTWSNSSVNCLKSETEKISILQNRQRSERKGKLKEGGLKKETVSPSICQTKSGTSLYPSFDHSCLIPLSNGLHTHIHNKTPCSHHPTLSQWDKAVIDSHVSLCWSLCAGQVSRQLTRHQSAKPASRHTYKQLNGTWWTRISIGFHTHTLIYSADAGVLSRPVLCISTKEKASSGLVDRHAGLILSCRTANSATLFSHFTLTS